MGTRAKFRDRDEHAPTREELDTIGFVLAVLKQHEKDFDRLVSKLNEITVTLRGTDKLVRRIDGVDKKLEILRSEISNIKKCSRIGS